MYYVEDLRDISAMPSVPMLAVPCRVVEPTVPESQLMQAIGKKASFTWVVSALLHSQHTVSLLVSFQNFPNLPMSICVDSVSDLS